MQGRGLPKTARSDVPARQEEERPVLLGVRRLELIAQPELPVVFQLQPHNRLAQRVPVLRDHTQRGTCAGSGRQSGRREGDGL